MTWYVEAEGVGTKLRPKASTSLSFGHIWLEERFLMAFLSKFDCSSWRMRQRLVLLKFLVVRISENSFLNDGLEYGCLSSAAVICLLDPS